MGQSWVILGNLEAILGSQLIVHLHVHLHNSLGALKRPSGSLLVGGILQSSRGHLGQLRAIMGLSWSHLGASTRVGVYLHMHLRISFVVLMGPS